MQTPATILELLSTQLRPPTCHNSFPCAYSKLQLIFGLVLVGMAALGQVDSICERATLDIVIVGADRLELVLSCGRERGSRPSNPIRSYPAFVPQIMTSIPPSCVISHSMRGVLVANPSEKERPPFLSPGFAPDIIGTRSCHRELWRGNTAVGGGKELSLWSQEFAVVDNAS